MKALTPHHVEELRQICRGPVIQPGHASYDDRRQTFNAAIDNRPALIVQPLDASEVSAVVRWAAGIDVGISIRGGGHSVAGHGVGRDSLMLDLVNLRTVAVDPVAR